MPLRRRDARWGRTSPFAGIAARRQRPRRTRGRARAPTTRADARSAVRSGRSREGAFERRDGIVAQERFGFGSCNYIWTINDLTEAMTLMLVNSAAHERHAVKRATSEPEPGVAIPRKAKKPTTSRDAS